MHAELNFKTFHTALFGVVLFGFSIGILVGHSLPELAHTLDRQVFADNRTTVTLYGLCATAYYFYWNDIGNEDGLGRRIRQTGQIITFLSWMFHREYWAWWRWYRGAGDFATADWMRDYLAWLTSLMQIGIWVGAVLILVPFIVNRFGDRGWFMAALLAPSVWMFWMITTAVM
jgi:hypothetical protein